jgi:hypothetical protein
VTSQWVVISVRERRWRMVSQFGFASRADAEEQLPKVLKFIRLRADREQYTVARVVLVDCDEETADIATPRPNAQPVFDWSGVE